MGERIGVGASLGDGVVVGVTTGGCVAIRAGVSDGAGVAAGVRVAVGDGLAVGARVAVGDGVAVGVRVPVGDRVAAGNGVAVGVRVPVGDRVTAGNGVAVGDRVAVGTGEAVSDRVTAGNGVDVGEDFTVGMEVGDETAGGKLGAVEGIIGDSCGNSTVERWKRRVCSSMVMANSESPGEMATYLSTPSLLLPTCFVGNTVQLPEYISRATSLFE